MLHKNRVFERITEWDDAGVAMVLATVIDTEGSTYSKTGDFIVISATGQYQGLVSGGCLEGDLASRAETVIAQRQSAVIDYDLGGEHDALWGMGAGCDGRLRILLSPMTRREQYGPLLKFRDRYLAGHDSVLALSVDHSDQLAALVEDDRLSVSGVADALHASLRHQMIAQRTGRQSALWSPDSETDLLLLFAPCAPRVLICGGGEDAQPVCQLLEAIGWSVTLYDHRLTYVQARQRDTAVECVCAPAVQVDRQVDLSGYCAAMIMSHHLDSDAHYLAAISRYSHWAYVGLLGPAHRRRRLLDTVGSDVQSLCDQLHGPAGLPIGATEPAAIALSIVAQMHQQLHLRKLV